jgi:2-hydroxy-4-carboxymuconate semialdehyde hemiacetal dehydrogenase
VKICLAGEGAQGLTHMQALQSIPGIEVATLAGGVEADTAAFAEQWNIPFWSLDLEACLAPDDVAAVILTTPSQVHAAQCELALNKGKHVLVEIPIALNLNDALRLVELEATTGLTCMVAHTRRYSRAPQEIYRQLRAGELHLHHIVSETYFFRRTNENRFGKARTWVDDLLWHHGCHMVDLVYWLLQDPDMHVWGQVGPDHSELGVPMDLTIGMRDQHGTIATAALSFNNHGPIDISTRFIGEQASFQIKGRGLIDHEGNEIASDDYADAFVQQNLEFFTAIAERREPLSSFKACLPTMSLLDKIQRTIDAG